MKLLINYADEPWKPAQHYATHKAYSVGKVDKVIEYGPENIDEEFRKKNADAFIINNKRVGKYGLWRPHILMDALNQVNDGDYVIYCDSGAFFIRSADYLIQYMEKKKESILLFEASGKESMMTKRDVFVYLNMDDEKTKNSVQRASTYFIVKKNEFTMRFFSEWLQIATEAPYLFTDEDNRLGKENCKDFVDTRHNQSVLSVLSKKYGISAYRNPSQWGWGRGIFHIMENKRQARKNGNWYPTVFLLHRSKKVTAFNLVAVVVQNLFPRTFEVVKGYRHK